MRDIGESEGRWQGRGESAREGGCVTTGGSVVADGTACWRGGEGDDGNETQKRKREREGG